VKVGIKLSKYLFVLVFKGSRMGMGFFASLGRGFCSGLWEGRKRSSVRMLVLALSQKWRHRSCRLFSRVLILNFCKK
jgi:hypothetical protein